MQVLAGVLRGDDGRCDLRRAQVLLDVPTRDRTSGRTVLAFSLTCKKAQLAASLVDLRAVVGVDVS